MKEKKIYINLMKFNLMKFNLMKSMHLKEIVARVAFLRFIIINSTINVMIENIRRKVIFNNEVEIDCLFK